MVIQVKPKGNSCSPYDYGLGLLPVARESCIKRDQQAPPFTGEAYLKGQRVEIDSADYAGKWVVLFFYSSDFTFV